MIIEKTSKPPLDGQFRFDNAARAAASEDFGHIVRRKPLGMLLPVSDQDIATAIRWAAAQGCKFAPQGRRHSVFGRSQVEGSVVADMTRLRTIHSIQRDRVVVDAGANWSEVLAETLPRGLAPPVLADYLELSVGGTLAVGEVGSTTSRFGLQSDNVLEMEVVTGKGESVICSKEDNVDLFDAVRAGLGLVAVILRVTLKLISVPQNVRRFQLFYTDHSALLMDERLLAADNRFEAANRAVYDRVRDAGGTLYPVSAFPMTPKDWRSHFGSAFGLLLAAKRKFDPDSILTPGYEVSQSGIRQAA